MCGMSIKQLDAGQARGESRLVLDQQATWATDQQRGETGPLITVWDRQA